jgi:hypothetical protein
MTNLKKALHILGRILPCLERIDRKNLLQFFRFNLTPCLWYIEGIINFLLYYTVWRRRKLINVQCKVNNVIFLVYFYLVMTVLSAVLPVIFCWFVMFVMRYDDFSSLGSDTIMYLFKQILFFLLFFTLQQLSCYLKRIHNGEVCSIFEHSVNSCLSKTLMPQLSGKKNNNTDFSSDKLIDPQFHFFLI